VVTETLYALLVARRDPVPVCEVQVITTAVGERRVREALLAPRTGQFHRFCRDYGIPSRRIRFGPDSMRVPRDAAGRPIEDVRTPAENLLVADCVLQAVRELTADPARALHASVAGGRKTLGLFLGIAFSLFARPQDRLSHVLIAPPELEGHPDFYYPPPRRTAYPTAGRTVSSREVRVELAEIPVLLLREKLPTVARDRRDYTALIREAQQELDREAAPPPAELDERARSLRIESRSVRLTPLEFGLYALLARRRKACGQPACPGCARCSLEAKAFLDPLARQEILAALRPLGVRDERLEWLGGWVQGGDERFLEVRSRINRKLRDALGAGRWAAAYQIASRRDPGAPSRYFIPLDPGRMVVA